MEIHLEKENCTRKITFKGKIVQDLLQQLHLNSETVLVTKDNEVLTEKEPISNKDKIQILSVVSGG